MQSKLDTEREIRVRKTERALRENIRAALGVAIICELLSNLLVKQVDFTLNLKQSVLWQYQLVLPLQKCFHS